MIWRLSYHHLAILASSQEGTHRRGMRSGGQQGRGNAFPEGVESDLR